MADRKRIVRLGLRGRPPLNPEFTNLIQNPSFEFATTGWTGSATGGGQTLTRVTTNVSSGTGSARMEKTSLAAGGLLAASNYDHRFAVTPGQKVSAAMEQTVVAAPAGTTVGVNIAFYDAALAYVSETIVTTAWTLGVRRRALNQNVTVPANAAWCAVHSRATAGGTTGTVTVDFDSVIAVIGTSVPSYFDGDTSGYWWTGTAHLSTSSSALSIVRDLEDGIGYATVRDSFSVKPGTPGQTFSATGVRYGGSRQVAETHENGVIGWTMLVAGATADECVQRIENVLGDIQDVEDLYMEWRPEGATKSIYYEIRGVPTWGPEYRWIEWQSTRTMKIEITIPVAPLAIGDQYTIPFGVSTLSPLHFTLPASVIGDAPAVADVTFAFPGEITYNPVWAMVGWTKKPTTPLSGSVAPFGVLEAETAGSLVGWSVVANSSYRGSSALEVAVASATGANANFVVDPSTMEADAFGYREMPVEVWALFNVPITTTALKVRASLTAVGTHAPPPQYTIEHGANGKSLSIPVSGNTRIFSKLGTITIPVDPLNSVQYGITVNVVSSTGTGTLGFDYIILVPSKGRAASITGSTAAAPFVNSGQAMTKTIYGSDLSGSIRTGAGSGQGPTIQSSGLGGQLIEFPPGNVDMVVKASSRIPDTGSGEHTQITVGGSVRITPRYWLARGS